MAVQLINGAALAAFPPDWKRGIDLALRWPMRVAVALDGREDRPELGNSPEAELTWPLIPAADNAEHTQRAEILRAALDSGQAAAPCFARPGYLAGMTPDGLSLTLESTRWRWMAADWLLIFDHDDQPQARQIQAVASNSDDNVVLSLSEPLPNDLPIGAAVYPLLFGQLEIVSNKDGSETCHLRVPTWRGAAAATEWEYYQAAPVALEALARAATERESWNQPTTDLPNAARRGFALDAPLADEDELADAETFFAALDGGRLPFWLPESEPAAIISAAAANPPGDAATRFLVQAPEQTLEPGMSLWFTHPTKPPGVGRVASVAAGSDSQTALVVLDVALSNAPDADWDVFRLRLVRLSGDALHLTRWADDRGVLRLEALEILSPGNAAEDVTPRLAYLYHFQNRRDASAVWRLTGHDAALTLAGEAYAPAAISHRIRAPMGDGAMQEEGIMAESAATPGQPLALQFLADSIEGLVVLTVQCLDLAAPDPAAAAQTVFRGQVARVRFTGAGLEADAWPSAGLTNGAAGFLIGASCNHPFCGPGCGLAEAAWSVAGAVGSIAGGQLTLAVDPGKPPGWFAGGRLIVGAGVDAETRTILDSAGSVLSLNAPLRRAQPGAALTARAGCSHLAEDCQGRFANFLNYGGHPFAARA